TASNTDCKPIDDVTSILLQLITRALTARSFAYDHAPVESSGTAFAGWPAVVPDRANVDVCVRT
ncbi:MAG: hypothetical protein R3176_02890, partial [Woeseiaceae bacterium]|nr:hypothetical protein [Woeseiaceae bacterium]